MITVVRGKKGLVAVYKDKKLIATGDKFWRGQDEEKCIAAHSDKDESIVEKEGDFSSFAEIPEVLEVTRAKPHTRPQGQKQEQGEEDKKDPDA